MNSWLLRERERENGMKGVEEDWIYKDEWMVFKGNPKVCSQQNNFVFYLLAATFV